jgi:tetratricopeptide (TPR) repeat protein
MKHPFKILSLAGLFALAVARHAAAQSSADLTKEGIKLFESGQAEEALVPLNRAIELDPKNAQAYNNRGRALAATHDEKGALADYEKAMQLDPKYSSPFTNRGNIKKDNRDYKGAIADYTHAIELKPDWFGNYVNRGEARNRIYDWDGAIADFTKAIEFKPEDQGFYFKRATARRQKHDWEGAIADYTAAFKDGRYFDALHARAETKNSAGDPDGALEDLNRLVAANRDYELLYYNFGNSWKLKKEWAKALAAYNRHVEIHPKDAFAYHARAEVKKARGDKDGAERDQQYALELDPEVEHPKTYRP